MIRNPDTSHPSKPWWVIFNPQASNGQLGRQWPVWQTRLEALLPNVVFQESTYPGAATALVQVAVSSGIRHIMAVGGDGTAHQVVNGIMRQNVVHPSEIVFALCPFGTGNDWIKSHGIPQRWAEWEVFFKTAHVGQQNVGCITYQNGGEHQARYFINVAGLAYDAFVVRYTTGKRTRLPGKLFYLWATLRCLFQYTPLPGRLAYENKVVETAFYTINLGIGRYSGGGMQLVPHAEPAGEYLALTYVGRIRKLEVLLNSFRFYEGRIARYHKATLAQTRHVQIDAAGDTPIGIEADGEFLGESPVEITLINAGLSVLFPENRVICC